jgi:hypothetical protein
MSAAGTVIATSTEGAGDMPSALPIGNGDCTEEGAQPFAEVLSLSSPDPSPPPGPPAPSALSPRTDGQPAPPETATSSDAATSSLDRARSRGGRDHGRSAPSQTGDRHAGRAGTPARPQSGRPQPGPAAQASLAPDSGPAPDESAAITPDATGGVAAVTATLPTPAGSVVATLPAATASVPASTAPAVSVTGTGDPGADGGTTTLVPDSAAGADPATHDAPPPLLADAADSGPGAIGRHGDDPVAGHTSAAPSAGAAVRDLPQREIPTASSVLQVGPATTKVLPGSAPGGVESAPAPVGAGASDAATVLSEEVPTAAFPDAGAAKAGGRVDIDDLAASISRPLAAGNGEYSVLVSLHPPELGEVRALLSLQGDVLHVTLTPEHASGFDALSEALPTLHDQLGGGGVEVNVTLGQPGDTPGGDGRDASEPGTGDPTTSGGTTPSAAPPAVPIIAGSPGRIHLVL